MQAMILGVGADWVELEEMRRALRRGGERLRQRLFTAAERRDCEGRRPEIEHLAAATTRRRGVERVHLSLSHTGRGALAVVVEG